MASLKARVQHIAEGGGKRGLNLLSNEQPRLTYTRLEDIEADANQPRKDMGELEGLQDSIRIHGIIQPLIVSPLPDNRFRLVAGERRFTAAKALGLAEVPTIVRTVEDHERLELQIIENLHRKDLNPFEEARSYQRLMDEFGLSQDEVGKRLGKSKASVNQTLRILTLPKSILQDGQTSEQVSKSVLLEIAKQPTQKEQELLWEAAKSGQLTVQQAREAKIIARKDPAGKWRAAVNRAERYLVVTDKALIYMQFPHARTKPTNEDIIQALEQALHRHRQIGASALAKTDTQ